MLKRWVWEHDLRSPEPGNPHGYVQIHVISPNRFWTEAAAGKDHEGHIRAYQTNMVAKLGFHTYYTANETVRRL